MATASTCRLCVIRFQSTTGFKQSQKLAFCIPRSDGSFVRVIYKDGEAEVEPHELCQAVDVNVSMMLNKAFVFATVMRDVAELKVKLPEYSDVCRRCRSAPRAES